MIIDDNNVTLEYSLTVANQGEGPLENVEFNDQITYPTAVTVGNVTVNPSSLTVNRPNPGIINISGNLGTLEPGDVIPISYTLPITSISEPGTFHFNNTAVASSDGQEASATVNINLEAVEIATEKCCIIDGNTSRFRITLSNVGNSPETRVGVIDQLVIPANVTVQFLQFSGICSATLPNGDPVPLNTNISNTIISIQCPSVTIPENGNVILNVAFRVISTSAFDGPAEIINTLQNVLFLNEGEQILLGIEPLPTSAAINIIGNIQCLNPCS